MLDPHQSAQMTPRRTAPSWLISMLVHAALIVVLGLLIRTEPRGAAEEPSRGGGIVLKRTSDEGEVYEGESEQDAPANATKQSPSEADTDAQLAALPAADAGMDLGQILPAAPTIGPGPRPGGGVGDATQATVGGGTSGAGALSGGKARVRFYDLEGEGSKFIFVLDRSESMRGARLASAKRELISSLASLDSIHQFQIIFFNHRLRTFDLTGGQDRIAFATDENKRLAASFIQSITADGGTDCASALLKAVSYRADVIFFLTDADDTVSSGQLEKIRRRNRTGASINTVQFGEGPPTGEMNFLKRVARQNGGRFVYVNTSRLRAE